MCINDIPFTIPRQIDDVRSQLRPNFERSKLVILRMDEYFSHSSLKENETSFSIRALAQAANTIKKLALFCEVLSIDESLPNIKRNLISIEEDNDDNRRIRTNSSVNRIFQQINKFDSITDFHQIEDFIQFDHELSRHRTDIVYRPKMKLSDMIYLKFCLILEIQRDEYESCLRILLHDIIFKYHLADFRLRCEIHVRKPVEHELVLERLVHGSYLNANYSAEFVLWAGDWIVEQEVELYIVLKIESLSMNKYINSKFLDMAHLHVKNIPHGASRIFLRELTPICRPHKIVCFETKKHNEIELFFLLIISYQDLLIRDKSNSKQPIGRRDKNCQFIFSKSFIQMPNVYYERQVNFIICEILISVLFQLETYVEILFQSPFDIYDLKRIRLVDQPSASYFEIPDNLTIRDITIDFIFWQKSSLHHHPIVLGVLMLSKHTDWYPVRKFWMDIEQNPNVKIKERFSFEGNIYM